jgi:hypothetical protein
MPHCDPRMVFSDILAGKRNIPASHVIPDCQFELLLQFCRDNPNSLAASYFLK